MHMTVRPDGRLALQTRRFGQRNLLRVCVMIATQGLRFAALRWMLAANLMLPLKSGNVTP